MIRMVGLFAGVFTAAASLLSAQTADEIMARVVEHQDAAAMARMHYVYNQNLLIRMKRANGKLAREEVRDYVVTPKANGVDRKLVHLAGKVGAGKKIIDYDKPEFRYKNIDIDGEVAQGLADDFGANKESKDGVNNNLFPLRSRSLQQFRFHLEGVEKFQDRDVWHISFAPAKKAVEKDAGDKATQKQRNEDGDDDGDCMAGDAYIDKDEYQPVMIATHFACKVPIFVKAALGTNVQNLGFKVTYKKFEDGVWFPVSYGGEMKFRVVFMYAREVGIGLINSDFKRAATDTSITYEQAEAKP